MTGIRAADSLVNLLDGLNSGVSLGSVSGVGVGLLVPVKDLYR